MWLQGEGEDAKGKVEKGRGLAVVSTGLAENSMDEQPSSVGACKSLSDHLPLFAWVFEKQRYIDI